MTLRPTTNVPPRLPPQTPFPQLEPHVAELRDMAANLVALAERRQIQAAIMICIDANGRFFTRLSGDTTVMEASAILHAAAAAATATYSAEAIIDVG